MTKKNERQVQRVELSRLGRGIKNGRVGVQGLNRTQSEEYRDDGK